MCRWTLVWGGYCARCGTPAWRTTPWSTSPPTTAGTGFSWGTRWVTVQSQCGMKIMMMMIGNFRGDITEYIAVAREMGRWREE